MTHRGIGSALSCFHQIEKSLDQSKMYIIPLPEFLHLPHYEVGFIDFATNVVTFEQLQSVRTKFEKQSLIDLCRDSFMCTNSNKPKEKRKPVVQPFRPTWL